MTYTRRKKLFVDRNADNDIIAVEGLFPSALPPRSLLC